MATARTNSNANINSSSSGSGSNKSHAYYTKIMACPILSDSKKTALIDRLIEEDFEEEDLVTADDEILQLLCPTLGLRYTAKQFMGWYNSQEVGGFLSTDSSDGPQVASRMPSAIFDLSKVELDGKVIEELEANCLCTQYRELVYALADSLLAQNSTEQSEIRFSQVTYKFVLDAIRTKYPSFLTTLDWHESRFLRDLSKCAQNLRFRKRKADKALPRNNADRSPDKRMRYEKIGSILPLTPESKQSGLAFMPSS